MFQGGRSWSRTSDHLPGRNEGSELIEGTPFSGIVTVFQSANVISIAGYPALMTLASTVLYF